MNLKLPESLAKFLGWLTVLGVLVSVLNELSNIDTYYPGVATLTRSIHALLGLLTLTWILFGHRGGKVALVVWLASGVIVIGVDHSKEFVETVIDIGMSNMEQRTVSHGYDDAYIRHYFKIGINLGPVLIGAWFWLLAKNSVFPLLSMRIPRKVFRFTMALGISAIIGTGIFICWLLSAPYVLIASEPHMSFYYEDEKLGDRFVRITPELMDKVGLSGSLPSDSWAIYTGNPYPWGFGIFLDDGTCKPNKRKHITIATSSDDEALLRQETPWGERIMPSSHGGSEPKERYQFYGLKRNLGFYVRPKAPTNPVIAGEYFPLEVSIEALQQQPSFAEMRFTVVTHTWTGADGDYPKRDSKAIAPEAFLALNENRYVEGTLQVQAPYRPGVYTVLINGWMYDKDGDYAEPECTLGYSTYFMITVVEQDYDLDAHDG